MISPPSIVRSDMAATEPQRRTWPTSTTSPVDWSDVARTLKTNLTQEPGTGGPGHHTFWLSDDRYRRPAPHDAVGASGRRPLHFSGGRGPQDPEHRARSALRFGVAIHGYDVALGKAGPPGHRRGVLQRLAGVFVRAAGGRPFDGGLTHDSTAPPSAGPPPWYVYEFTPTMPTGRHQRPGGATRWTF